MADDIVSRRSIEYLSTAQISADPRNPRVHKARHVKSLAKSIASFGFNVPLLIDDNGVIVAGHGRFEAAKLLGLSEVPVIRVSHLSEHQRRAFMIADNRLHDLSSWDRGNLASILLELADADLDFDIEATGFSVAEIDLMVSAVDLRGAERDDGLPPTGPAIARLGDVFLMGEHRIVCGDACDPAVWQTLMGRKTADAVVTDPPFNVPMKGHVTGLGKTVHRPFVEGNGEWSEEEFVTFLHKVMRNCADASRNGSLHYWAMDWRHQYELNVAARAIYTEQVNLCVWNKTAAGMGSFYRSQHELYSVWRKGKERHRNNVELGRFGRSRSNVWTYPGANSFSRTGDEGNLLALHPTVKPVALLADIMLDCTRRGDVVVDPFAGSGSTVIAAEKVGRKAFCIELDPVYVDTIIRRWQRWSGQPACRSDGVPFDALECPQ